jgi:hypothetical protein
MDKVILRKINHRNQDWIGVFGPNRKQFNFFVRENKAVWSRTWKCYLMPFNKGVYEKIISSLQSAYSIDNEGLKVAKEHKDKTVAKSSVNTKAWKAADNTNLADFLTDCKGLADWELRQQ